jgi:phage repressor protein C with HTH and peptisase S24 domain
MKERLIFTNSLAFWLEKKGLTQVELAKRMGVNPNTISQYKTGERTPPMDKLEVLVGALGISLPEFFACKDESKPDTVFIERLKARPRAGTGGLETDGEHAGFYSFHSQFIARKRGTEKSMKIFEVAGDSMSPTLSDGDLIMVNLADKDVRSGYIYLIRMEDELMVKRLENRPGGILLIRSDNSDYADIPVNKNDPGIDLEVFGRMVWSCREY